ncbi:hypothetical protein C7441_10950 [Pseudaminobacter salicylatoxidans]|uniref:Uncharacterized protein n=1 Tax=Pseudaminobacter salicylatoxidans TaxID=93369 RepID=A0A316C5V5_PSESE|nr:hypothetical protein C7441_10950 [Pseudaminobacter salicylatoxidans]
MAQPDSIPEKPVGHDKDDLRTRAGRVPRHRKRRLSSGRATYSSKRLVASRSRSYRLASGNGGNHASRRTVQSS